MDQTYKASLRKVTGMGLLAAFLLVGTFALLQGTAVSAKDAQVSPTWNVYLPVVLEDFNTPRTPIPTASPTQTPTFTATPTQTLTPTLTQTPTPTEIEFFALYPGQAHITDGIIVFAIIIVVVIISGIVWGGGMKIQRRAKPGSK
jgi:hypothetical protein